MPTSPLLTLGPEITREYSAASSREWLETNGLGGWSSSTVSGAHTRRYHGLLVAALHPPVDRRVLLSRLDETVRLEHEHVELGCSAFPGVVAPQGYRYLTHFALDPWPTFTYDLSDVRLRKSIAMIHGEDTVVIRYELLRAPGSTQLELRPFFAGRDYHHLMKANDGVCREARFADGTLEYAPYADLPAVYLSLAGSRFAPSPDWYYNYEYAREAERGLDFGEDLFTPGALRAVLEPGSSLAVIASLTDPRGRSASDLLTVEAGRRATISIPASLSASPGPELVRAADQFLVRRGDDRYTILAGYHWFTDWGRDTMISLPGICLVTERYEQARGIFRAFAAHVSQGMIPNRFPDAGEQPDYNTVDATLWFVVAVGRYVQYTGDVDFVRRELWPALEEIVAAHRRGTRYGIRVDGDGLLTAGEEGVQLTWMDAKVGDWVVTPRIGKPVEINALWYNALRTMERLAHRLGDAPAQTAPAYADLADGVAARFAEAYWNEAEGCLCDVVLDGDAAGSGEGPGLRADASVRPNQVFALSLPFPLLDAERSAAVLGRVEADLLTPAGLRSLAPGDAAYRGRCTGSPLERDGAYHQGTVWGWLLGPYLTALVRVRGEAGRAQGRQLIDGARQHLTEAGLGSVSEVFDGDAPHTPRGCIAQAWSVAELLRAWHEDIQGNAPEPL